MVEEQVTDVTATTPATEAPETAAPAPEPIASAHDRRRVEELAAGAGPDHAGALARVLMDLMDGRATPTGTAVGNDGAAEGGDLDGKIELLTELVGKRLDEADAAIAELKARPAGAGVAERLEDHAAMFAELRDRVAALEARPEPEPAAEPGPAAAPSGPRPGNRIGG